MSKHNFVGIDADSLTHNRLVEIIPDENQQSVRVIVAAQFTEASEVTAQVRNLKPRNLTVIIGYEKGAKVFQTERFHPNQFETAKATFLITDELNADYFLVGSNALISATNPESLTELGYIFPDLGAKTQFTINHTSIVLTYGFHRNYPDLFGSKTTGLLHVTGETVTFIVIDHGKLVWHGRRREIQLDDSKIDTKILRTLVKSAQEELLSKEENFQLDYILLSGELSTSNTDLMSNFKTEGVAYTLENWDLRRMGLFDFTQCALTTTQEWVVPLCGALMAVEGLGIDLSLTNQHIIRELTQDMKFNVEESVSEKLLQTSVIIGQAIWPAIVAQSRIISSCLLIALVLFSYRYWVISSETTQLLQQMDNETHRSTSLANVKREYADYKRELEIINDRISQISSIRESQMAAPTTLKELLDSTPNLVNYAHIEVAQTNIKAEGESYDKATVVNFISKMGLSGNFEDVNPVYDSENSKCAFKFSTHYRGIVQSLNPRSPIPQQIAKIN